MYKVSRARREDFERVYPLLEEFNNERLSREDWLNIFTNHWNNEEDYFGHFVCDGSEPVGFAGLLFAHRPIGGKICRFGNISNWILKEAYRGKGLIKPLIEEQLQLEDTTLTVFTPADATQAVLAKRGFEHLDSEMKIALAVPCPRISRGPRVVHNLDRMRSRVGPAEQKVMDDHGRFPCRFALIESPDGPCLISYNRIQRDNLPFARLLYASDRGVLSKHLRRVLFRICLRARVVGMLIMHRLVEHAEVPFSISRRKVEIFRSDDVPKDEVDLMYSEMPILGH